MPTGALTCKREERREERQKRREAREGGEGASKVANLTHERVLWAGSLSQDIQLFFFFFFLLHI